MIKIDFGGTIWRWKQQNHEGIWEIIDKTAISVLGKPFLLSDQLRDHVRVKTFENETAKIFTEAIYTKYLMIVV